VAIIGQERIFLQAFGGRGAGDVFHKLRELDTTCAAYHATGMSEESTKVRRWTKSPLAEPEKRVLVWIAARTPRWLVPDHLSVLGLLSAVWIGVAYGLSVRNPAWLWGASLGLALHWLGDSLDGTLARVRHIERPRYGFYVDHLGDAVATVAIGLGLGLSPFMLLAVGLTIVIGYLLLSINVYLETLVVDQFRLGYGILGPTEVRIMLILLNTLALVLGPIPFHAFGVDATAFDVVGVLTALGMMGMLLRRIIRNLRHLSRLEPPNVVKEPKR
jgi:phosphatidylglycerophosphate synthase